MILSQIFDSINIGIIILDRDLKVYQWNRWMESHSNIPAEQIIGTPIIEAFPNLDTRKFLRSCKSVFAFGNFCFFSQKLHHYIFPFKSISYAGSKFDYMQQSCAMGPIRDENNEIEYLFIYVHDVTEVAMYEQKLLEMNWKDGLTGIYNRKFLEMKLEEECNRSMRYSSALSIVMIDIDHFKKINDEYGHQCGDAILRSISALITSAIRNVDFLARYGGEEFCCILPETKIDGAAMISERFREIIEQHDYRYNDMSVKVTISLGVAAMTPDIQSHQALIEKADEALYKAKREGRNKVIVAA